MSRKGSTVSYLPEFGIIEPVEEQNIQITEADQLIFIEKAILLIWAKIHHFAVAIFDKFHTDLYQITS